MKKKDMFSFFCYFINDARFLGLQRISVVVLVLVHI